ncbi:MAG TPA: phospholipase D-like domain-containing protein [Thermoanaerobaculia bacterium]|nr:phospholipase D-like domain-containing protein [Thermoanaerobaculia bacterium]
MSPDGVITGVLAAAALAAALAASLHAILYKRDVRAAIGWAGFIWVAPYIGPLIYLLFGVNRIRRRATLLRPPGQRAERRAGETDPAAILPPDQRHLANLVLLGDRVCHNRAIRGNGVQVLEGGPSAFAAILPAIESAHRSIILSTYIFADDSTGRRFVEALSAAAGRGVDVRVLLDPVGSRLATITLRRELTRRGVRVAGFLSRRFPLSLLSVNLRSHRKLIIVDGAVAFTGGMNISDDYANAPGAEFPTLDMQFEIRGPVIAELYRVFAADWYFTTGESLPDPLTVGPLDDGVAARAVSDGPDEEFERTRWLMLGAIAAARESIRIVTPYFLPDLSIITALNVAALRGARVEIYIPEVLDHRPVKWASNALLWQVLEKGCRVWFTPPPFDHSKLFTIDGAWTLFGSSNWDARSLRLNFELNVEVFGPSLAAQVNELIDQRRRRGREITLEMIDARPLPIRIRDGLARLLTPYL